MNRPHIAARLVDAIWLRDIGNFFYGRCYACQKQVSAREFECGHVKSHANGGRTETENLKVVCRTCNQQMGTTDMHVWIHLTRSTSAPLSQVSDSDAIIIDAIRHADDAVILFAEQQILLKKTCDAISRKFKSKYMVNMDAIRFTISNINQLQKGFARWQQIIRIASDVGSVRPKSTEFQTDQIYKDCRSAGVRKQFLDQLWNSLLRLQTCRGTQNATHTVATVIVPTLGLLRTVLNPPVALPVSRQKEEAKEECVI